MLSKWPIRGHSDYHHLNVNFYYCSQSSKLLLPSHILPILLFNLKLLLTARRRRVSRVEVFLLEWKEKDISTSSAIQRRLAPRNLIWDRERDIYLTTNCLRRLVRIISPRPGPRDVTEDLSAVAAH